MKNNITLIIIFILIFLMLYQDLPLVNTFGELARSPIVFVCPFLLLYLLSFKKTTISFNSLSLLVYTIVIFFISILYAIIIYIKNDSLIVFNENIILKAIKMSMYPIIALIFYIFWYRFINNNKRSDEILYKVFKLLQIFYLGYLFIESYYLKTQFILLQFLHSNPEKYYRIRLFTMEESWSGTIFILLAFFPIYLTQKLNKTPTEKIRIYITSILLLVTYLFVSESKGFLFLIVISILPAIIYKLVTSSKYKIIKPFLFPVLIVGFIIVLVTFIKIVDNELATSVTFGTRFTSIFSAIYVFIENPFGVGWTGMAYTYTTKISKVIDSGLMSYFNLSEIKSYISTSKNLSTKSYFLDSLIEGGLFFIIFFYTFFVRIYFRLVKQKQSLWLKLITLYFILAGIIFITYHIKYEIWFFFAYVESCLNNNINEKKNIASL